MSNVAPISPSKMPTLKAGNGLAPIHPQSIEDCYRLSTMAFKSGLLKQQKSGYGDNAVVEDADATLARGTMLIMQGMEIGVPAMQSLQLLALINGRITAHSEAVPGIMLAHGLKIKRWWSGQEMKDDWTAHVEITRPDGEKHVGTFSVAQAKRAGLWDQAPTVTKFNKTKPNDSAWFRYPDRMMMARALGFAGKDGASDVLKGITVREEVEDMMRVQAMRDVTPDDRPTTALADLPDIPDEAPASDTDEAREAIKSAINVEMLEHVREAYGDADWSQLEADYDAKHDELHAVSA